MAFRVVVHDILNFSGKDCLHSPTKETGAHASHSLAFYFRKCQNAHSFPVYHRLFYIIQIMNALLSSTCFAITVCLLLIIVRKCDQMNRLQQQEWLRHKRFISLANGFQWDNATRQCFLHAKPVDRWWQFLAASFRERQRQQHFVPAKTKVIHESSSLPAPPPPQWNQSRSIGMPWQEHSIMRNTPKTANGDFHVGQGLFSGQ